ncbi:MAG: 2Fe-2S iron-sulfur cluster-binding protein [Hydrogenophaga sp.]|jgi:truncated hemoglobin YjbI/ferredoxin|uniref:2Fe-2S iron-sulfur cluster-binding protein n=1 Tax=Hydrogenophaga sp. TaxID=1904254 RepID=UPI00260F1AAA|nr:2Fe-2S iron-sulfur cluster-binding protein [Hydrogenophaga sp.]MDD3784086.1 2Fe-2S iron-sulfur cluster-binding protein [Hydrogenophaga sp.]MDX9967439.1 2Fe-2S iron-sulfur cluster-binding protein [Hydrogenophaga sp.]
MTRDIVFQDKVVSPFEGETVLDALLRVGADVAFSCKGGSCHTCMLHCLEGEVPDVARRALPERLRSLGYFLPCRCTPTGPMRLGPKRAQDMVTSCMLVEVDGHESGSLRIVFEPSQKLEYRMGQTLRLVNGAAQANEPVLMLSSDPAEAVVMEARWVLGEGETVPDVFAPGAEFGGVFEVRGPFTPDYDDLPEQTTAPTTDPALWDELDQGRRVRQVLDAFYAKVYADPLLAPFFHGVTPDRAAGKQYSFLQQRMTGAKVYWGDAPRNAHHWMVIPHALFDHRQRLMVQTLREHGLSEGQIQRWTRFEEYYRADIVKDKAWPRKVGDTLVRTEGFALEVLGEASLCDHCGAEVPNGTTVRYHLRTGQISCPACMAGRAGQQATD